MRPYWLDTVTERSQVSPLNDTRDTDLCIVGGGFTGLWAALFAKADAPDREVIILEAEQLGFGASSRNGGFIRGSLTHGILNGLARFPREIDAIETVGHANYQELLSDLDRLGIECEFESTGSIGIALARHQMQELERSAEALARFGHKVELLSATALHREVRSPIYLGGLWLQSDAGLVNPAKLVRGLGDAAKSTGVIIFEESPVRSIRETHTDRLEVNTDRGCMRARQVLLATGAYHPLIREIRKYVVPVYDYAMVTEPLSSEQRDEIGWYRRQGLHDGGNLFHYYRQTSDNRILYGGYDAVWRFRGPVRADLDDHEPVFAKLSQHFFTTFPQLRGILFTHRWGGPIDTCSRFSVFFGRAFGGRLVYSVGYTGLGVAATRFGAKTALELLEGRMSESGILRFVLTKPIPFPPEPLRTAVIQATRNRLEAADRNGGRRGVWLRALDQLGLGFDS